MLTQEQLKEIEERCNKATPGPWTIRISSGEIASIETLDGSSEKSVIDADSDGVLVISHEDLAFILAARQDIPLLLEEIRFLYQYFS